MIFIYFLWFLFLMVIVSNYSDWRDKCKEYEQQDKLKKHYQDLYKSWSSK